MMSRRRFLMPFPSLAGISVLLLGCAYYAPSPPPADYSAYPPPPPPTWSPNMVWLPSPEVYVGLGVAVPLFFDSGVYYSNYNGRWYSGPTYRGPWQRRDGPPPRLNDFHPNSWGDYQSRARHYSQGDPHWKHFNPPH